MLFLQPVVVSAGAADQTPPAEVRVANRSTPEQPTSHPTWSGTLVAQGAMDQRSPFGTNAPNANDGTPDFVAPNPASQNQAPGGTTSNGPIADPSSTKIPPSPAPNRPDAGPPPPSASSSGTVVAPPPETPPATATPSTTSSTSTQGAGNASGSATTPAPPSNASPMGPPSSSSTFPGANQGASSTR